MSVGESMSNLLGTSLRNCVVIVNLLWEVEDNVPVTEGMPRRMSSGIVFEERSDVTGSSQFKGSGI
jgi:hypothetical protein